MQYSYKKKKIRRWILCNKMKFKVVVEKNVGLTIAISSCVFFSLIFNGVQITCNWFYLKLFLVNFVWISRFSFKSSKIQYQGTFKLCTFNKLGMNFILPLSAISNWVPILMQYKFCLSFKMIKLTSWFCISQCAMHA